MDIFYKYWVSIHEVVTVELLQMAGTLLVPLNKPCDLSAFAGAPATCAQCMGTSDRIGFEKMPLHPPNARHTQQHQCACKDANCRVQRQ